jgi:hypothetical protein
MSDLILALSPLIALVIYIVIRVTLHVIEISYLNMEFRREARRINELEKWLQ